MTENKNPVAIPSNSIPIGPWFRWFAWYPVNTVDRGVRWLRPVWRRRYEKRYRTYSSRFFWNQVANPNGDNK